MANIHDIGMLSSPVRAYSACFHFNDSTNESGTLVLQHDWAQSKFTASELEPIQRQWFEIANGDRDRPLEVTMIDFER